MIHPFELNRTSHGGFALVLTLIMLVLAAGVAVALLTNASLDRSTSRSTLDRYLAELAVENGLEAAKKALNATPAAGSSITADDTFMVVRVDGPLVDISPAPSPAPTPSYYFLAKARPGTANQIDYYPLFSGAAPVSGQAINLAASAAQPVTRPTPPAEPDPSDRQAAVQTDRAKSKILKAYPEVAPWLGSPSTKWIEVIDPNDTGTPGSRSGTYQRYAYWIEDLGGYLDGSVAGNTADNGSHKRPLDQSLATKRYVSSPGELAMFTLFNPTVTADPGKTGADILIANRALQITAATNKQLVPALASPDLLSPSIAARLTTDAEQALVPFGYGYADEGNQTKPRVDLNAQVASGGDAAVQAIASKINDNLPTFGATRKGGASTLDYVKSISASILDYADTDSEATTGADYRGIDSYPFINEIYTMKWWTRTYQSGGTFWVEIQMDTWVELWNPSNQAISGTAAIEILEHHPVQAGTYTYTFGTNPDDLKNGSSVNSSPSGIASVAVNMQPNEYTTHKLRTDTFQYNTGVAPPLIFPAAGVNTMPLTPSLRSNYKLKWNGKLVDSAGSTPALHVQRLSGGLRGPPNYIASNKNWRGSYPGFGYTQNASSPIPAQNTMGDPRSAFMIGSAQVAIAYDEGSSFWVRNNRSNISDHQIYAQQRPAAWPDSGHNTATVVTAPGGSAAAGVQDPPTSRPTAAVIDPTKAPAVISNSGHYSTIAELANIYDPGLWNIPPDPNPPANTAPGWSDIRKSDITNAGQADSNFGGGMTLRIGRPEFTLFDRPGARAWQLLDLLHSGDRVDTQGLVNINTASSEVLRALGASVLLNRDPDKVPAGALYPPYVAKQADLFAEAVIAARPFLSPAHLSGMKLPGDTRAFFGNIAAWGRGNQPAPTEWNDSGTEEYFAKVFPLTTVRSRNFRVFVTGQSLDRNNNVVATVSKVFQVSLNPTRDSTGKITSQRVITTYEAQLPL